MGEQGGEHCELTETDCDISEAILAANALGNRVSELERTVAQQAADFANLRKYVPPIAAKRARQMKIAFELAGLAIAATGAWLIYTPAAFLVVGVWILGDVLSVRGPKKKGNE